MKIFRCIIKYSNALTTIDLAAENADAAIKAASMIVTLSDAIAIEVVEQINWSGNVDICG